MTIACKEIKQHKQTKNKLTQNPVQSKVAALKTVQKHLCNLKGLDDCNHFSVCRPL